MRSGAASSGTASSFGQLRSLARAYGIQTSYIDMSGHEQDASPETLRALLATFGVPAGGPQEIGRSWQESRIRVWRRWIEPIIVTWDAKPIRFEVRLPASFESRPLGCQLKLEDGTIRNHTIDLSRTRRVRAVEVDRQPVLAKQITLPELPFGYHQLEIATADCVWQSMIIAAPTQSYAPPGWRKTWGVFLPMYALHSEKSWGAGNFSDGKALSEWTASLGGGVVATLPLMAAFLDGSVCEPSPYSPASRLFWNEFYLDVTLIPEFRRCGAAQRLVGSIPFQNQLHQFRHSSIIDYLPEMAARRKVLELLAESFFASTDAIRHRGLGRFLRERPKVEDYARFRAVCEKANASWQTWPARLRDGHLRSADYEERVKRYHLYVQFVAQQQMDSLIRSCQAQGVSLCLDLPLGVHPDGYDVWRHREAFALGATTGAPPDAFFTKGQNWGFAPLHPERVREQRYRYVLDFLRFQMRHTGLLRIDHVMGLHRLYWIPKGFSAREGAYVRYREEELHALLSLESHRLRTMLVGENLGTVPRTVHSGMRRHRLRQLYVLQYEQKPDPQWPLRAPPADSVASLNTHDMPMFAAHWRGLDIADRAALGLLKRSHPAKERARRQQMNENLVLFLVRHGFLKRGSRGVSTVLRACLEFLSASRAEIVLANLEDFWGETQPQNVPGTSGERPNWRRKARLTLEQIMRTPELVETLRRIDSLRRKRAHGTVTEKT